MRAYDDGCEEESIRIAVVIRVLLHEGNDSSLLQKMNQKLIIRLVSTAKALPSNLVNTIDHAELMAGVTFGDSLVYDPVPAGSPVMPCDEWWNQTVYIQDRTDFRRCDVVLAAANKDGGAHVDMPDRRLKAFMAANWIKTETTSSGEIVETPIGNNHFRMLRRFADEILNSQDLLKLAE